MLVNCKIHINEDLDVEGSRCSFYVSKPVTLAKLRESFPYEGKFHFRQKVVVSSNFEYVWMDLTHDNKEIINDPQDGLIIQVLVLSLDVDEYQIQKYNEYLEECRKITNTASVNKIVRTESDTEYHRENESYRNDNREYDSANVDTHSHNEPKKKSFSAISNTKNAINLNSMKTGVTNIWNVVKSVAANIQQSAQNYDVTPPVKKILSELNQLLSTPLDYNNSNHQNLMIEFWKVLFPEKKYEKESILWRDVGFQKNEPSHDLRTTGLLAVQAMTHLCLHYADRSQVMLQNNKVNTKTNYPFVIVGINIILLLAELFHLKDEKFLNTPAPFWQMFQTEETFYEVFNICFIHVDNLWVHRKAVRSDFGKIIGEVKQLVSQIIQRGPISIEDFKHIAADEGMPIVN